MPEPLDLRALEPPEPLLRILDRLDESEGPHQFLLAREPVPLYALLRLGDWKHEASFDERGVLLRIYRRLR